MKRKLKVLFIVAICLVTLITTMVPSFAAAYSTYTYSIDGTQLASPDAYTPDKYFDSLKTGIVNGTKSVVQGSSVSTSLAIANEYGYGYALKNPSDLVVDDDGNIYICDVTDRVYNESTGNYDTKVSVMNDKGEPEDKAVEKISRIVVLDEYYQFRYAIMNFVNDTGVKDSINEAQGLFIKGDKIYIADTGNKRIVVLNRENGGRSYPTFDKIVNAPSADVLTEEDEFTPVAVASDGNNIYVASSTTPFGIIAMNMKGEFKGYIGGQKVSVSAWDIFRRIFLTKEQRALQGVKISTPYNNITIDEDGFIYATISIENKEAQQNAINSKSTSADYAPVKKLNTNGDDIMNRSGFYPPSGEVMVNKSAYVDSPTGPSEIIDVALGPEKTWSIIDETRQRIFTYDKNGNLLFAFGDDGKQLGNLKSVEAIAYQGNNMIVLDRESLAITVYSRTEYGDLLINALANDNNRNYAAAEKDYKAILERNINFDTAYIGIAKALYRNGYYEEAMEQYSYAYDTDGYSQAFKMYRKEWISKYIIIVPIVVVAVVLLLSWFFKFAARVNAKTAITLGKRTFGQELLFAFHLMFHPFDGFWDLKHEKRGSLRGAFFYLGVTVLTFTYNSVGRSYMYNPRGTFSGIFTQLLSVCVPVILWVAANWCLTTLFDGEGSVKDIFIATGYSLAPLPLMMIPATLLTHILASSESGIITLFTSFGWIWVGLLLFFGIMVTHDYSMVKNLGTTIGTIVGMAFIMFICILFATLVTDMFSLVSNIITEITYRM